MDPPPPFDHPHHRRGHHYTDQFHHFVGGSGGGGGGAVPVRSRYEYDAYERLPTPCHHIPSDHHHHHHHHHPPPPPPPPLPPQHRHDVPSYVLPLRAPPDAYSSPTYQNPAPHHHYHNHQRLCDDAFRPVDEIRRVATHHHHHPQQQQHLPWEESEDERRRYTAAHQVRLSPSGSRKRQRCAMLDCGDLESTSSSGPPPRCSRQQPHPNYALDDNFVDRTSAHPGCIGHEGFSMHTDSKGNRKMQMPSPVTLPGSPHAMGAGYPRRTPQKSAPTRVSVWQRIEEKPVVFAPSSPRPLPKEVHVSPCKSNNVGSASKELASVISVDCKGKSAGGNDVDSNTGTKKNAGKNNENVLASILVKPSPESKEKKGSVKKVARKPDKVQKNVVGSTSRSVGLTACPRAGVKKAKKIVIKKIVRKIGGKDKEISSSIVSEKRDNIDGNANACETEEGEITTSSFEKDVISAHNLVSTGDTTVAGNGVDGQKEADNNLTNPSKRNAASVIESKKILYPTSVSGSEHPGKDEDRSSMNPGDNIAASAIESTKVLDTSGSEHPGKEQDRISLDSGVRNAAFVSEDDNSQKQEGKILDLSGKMNVAIASNSVRISDGCEDSSMEENKVAKDASENNAVYMDRVKVNHDATEVSGNEDARREDSKILIGTNEEGVLLVNNFIGGPRTTDVTVSVREGAQKNDGIIPMGSGEKSIASSGVSVGTPRTTEEVGVSQDAQEEEGNMLTHPSEKDFVSVVSWGTLNTVEVSVNEGIQEKEGRMPTESSEANTSVIHHAKASNTTELSVHEHTQKKESQMPIESCETNTFERIHHLEAPNTAEVVMSKYVRCEVVKSLVGSNERHAGTTDNSANTPEFDETEDNHMEDLLNDRTALNERDAPLEVEDTYIFNLPSSRNVDSTNALPLDDGPMDDSTNDIILNNGIGRNATSQAAELMHLRRAYLSPENDFTLVPSRESSSVSGNSEQSVPTALTLGSNIYFSSAESEGQPEENHELVEGNQGLGVATVTAFDSLGKRKVVAGDDLISAGIQNWLTLPPAVNNIAMSGQILNDDVTVRKDRLGLDQNVDDDSFVSQDHDVTQDMDQRGSVHPFFSQDLSVRLCGSDMPRSDLLAPKESSRDVENPSGIALSGFHPISSINVLDRYDHQMVDCPVDNLNRPILSALESTNFMDAEVVSSEVPVDPDRSYHSNTEDPGVESSTKQDLLPSWMEAIVSEAKKEHHPCKSTLPSISSPDKLLASKEDSRRAVLDSAVNSVVKSPQMNFASSMLPKVAPKQVNLPSSSRDMPNLSQSARHRTWHRFNLASSTSSLRALHPSGLPPKLPLKKNGKTQNSYIRKGNALIRNPATGNHPHSSSSLDTQNKLNKPMMRRSMNFGRKVDSNDFVAHSNISVERPKTPPLPLHTKSISCTTNLTEQLSQTLQKHHVPETEKEDSIGQLNSGADYPSIKFTQQSEPSDASKVVYVRPKSNKLVAAQRQHPGDSINSSMDKVLSPQLPTTSDLYFKKRKNQIILSSSPSDGQNTKDMTPTVSLNSGENKGLMIASSKNSITGVKDRPHKALQATNNVGSFSHVWTLSGKQAQRKGFVGTSHMKAFPRILPWKRKIYYKDFRSSHTSLLNTSSLRIVRKLLQTRNRDMIYTVSTDGFSLRKSGVLSVGGSNLKWSRSLEKHSEMVNEEATLAVAEVERKKREKRKRHSLRDKGRNDQYSVCVAGNQFRNNNQASSDLRSSTCNDYVRVNKGNQLVRNPKKVIRMLASEKVRWSLHTVRSRLAKKQQYCQFFTRFGECKKPGGKCPYVHDRAKVTICTKFLKGLCSNTSCKLTHKVLPERMPDCSYFLRGLCTNTACPYRHVKVNSNAPVCEDFLKGYCADGDECHKKHSHVCPIFEATGECPQQSRCKLHHPKKKIKSKRSRPDILQNSNWGRYFDTSIGHDSETRKVSTDEEERQKPQHVFSGRDLVDFIRLDADADEDVADVDATDDIQLMELDSGDFNAQADNLDSLIKPLRIMRTARV